MAGKRFPEEFNHRDNIKKEDIFLVNNSETDVDEYATIEEAFTLLDDKFNTKADKVSGATDGNFASLDANGNLEDSGKKASDFVEVANIANNLTTEDEGNVLDARQGKALNGAKINKDGSNSLIETLTFKATDQDCEEVELTLTWNASQGTYDMQLPDGVTGQMFQELHLYGKCVGDVDEMDVVQFAGAQGDHILVKKAVPSEIKALPRLVIGVATNSGTNGRFVKITWFGYVNDVSTGTWSESDILYYESGNGENGALTNIKPTSPNPVVVIGAVAKESTGEASNGRIFVRPEFYGKITQQDDVHAPTLTAGDVLMWTSNLRFEVFNLTTALNAKEVTANKVTSLSSSSTDTQYPSAKAVYRATLEVGRYFPNINHIWYNDNGVARSTQSQLNYVGVVRYVDSANGNDSNNGQTIGAAKKTITSAYTASANGDIIQLIDGTYSLSAESGGYLLLNAKNKGVCIRGNSSNASAVVIQHTVSNYGIRFRDCGNFRFENIKFLGSSSVEFFSVDYNTSYGNQKQQFINCIIEHTTTGVISNLAGASISGTYLYQFLFNNVVFNLNSKTGVVFNVQNNSDYVEYLFDACVFNIANKAAIEITNGKPKVSVYNCNIYVNGNVNAVQIGTDTATPTIVYSLFDFRDNSIVYNTGFSQHALLVGRGVKNAYIINNTIEMGAIDSCLAIGIALKGIPDIVGDVKLYGNYVKSPRPFYIKGGKNNDVRFNSFISNIITFAAFEYVNFLDGSTDILSSGNNIECNNFISLGVGIRLYNESASEAENITIQTNTLKDNRYYFTTYYLNYLTDNYSFADRNTFFDPANDLNSVVLMEFHLPIRLN